MSQLRDWAKDFWPQILGSLGLTEDQLSGRHTSCPGCGGSDRFRLILKDPHGGYFCGSERGDGFDLIRHVRGCSFAEAVRFVEGVLGPAPEGEVDPKFRRFADKLRDGAMQIERSAYLESRGLETPASLRWHKAVPYHTADERLVGTYPAMLAPVTRHGHWLTYHVTYLQGGRKADLSPCRKLLPGPSNKGAGVALYPAAAEMGVAEGIETAIAAKMIHGLPVHATLSTSLMKCWEPPSIARSIVIFADWDAHLGGHAAAWALAHRLALRGLEVDVSLPPRPGDWNDELLSRKKIKTGVS